MHHAAGHKSISEGQLWPADRQRVVTMKQTRAGHALEGRGGGGNHVQIQMGPQGQTAKGVKPGTYYAYAVLTLQDDAVFTRVYANERLGSSEIALRKSGCCFGLLQDSQALGISHSCLEPQSSVSGRPIYPMVLNWVACYRVFERVENVGSTFIKICTYFKHLSYIFKYSAP